jgi:hypothetical protein
MNDAKERIKRKATTIVAGANPEFEVGEVGMRYARDAWIGVDRDPCPAGLESLFLAGLAGCGGPHSATSTAKMWL